MTAHFENKTVDREERLLHRSAHIPRRAETEQKDEGQDMESEDEKDKAKETTQEGDDRDEEAGDDELAVTQQDNHYQEDQKS